MKGFLGMLLTIALVGLVSIGLINFGVILQADNDVEDSFIEDASMKELNASLYSGLLEFRNSSTGLKNASESEQLEEPIGDLSLGSIFSSGIKFSKFIFVFPTALLRTFKTNFGVASIILNVILAMISIIAIFLWWRIIKTGQ